MDYLKPCKFCGGEAILQKRPSHFTYVCCKVCYSKTGNYPQAQQAIAAWNQCAEPAYLAGYKDGYAVGKCESERTCHMTCKKSGPFYDVWHFDCCDKEWSEPRCDSNVIDYPGVVCPFCGAKVVE